MRGGDIDGDANLLAWPQRGAVDSLDQGVERFGIGGKLRPPPSLIGNAPQPAAICHDLAARPVDAPCHYQRLIERGGGDRHNQEILDIHPTAGMGAAAKYLDHRHRQGDLGARRQIAPQRFAACRGSGMQCRHRDRDRGITAEPRLVRRAVQLDQCAVDRVLVGNRHRVKGRGNLAIDIRDCAIDAQTTENRSAIP